ncbi:phosphonate C-P lyase system protein PhnH [Alsobacter sp. KACC 23698]|uniref:Phosphonate C-P lyase system protein PhnH n=1 Tax=Alsobacter sp. KACC 23698 TaxID=3149229 RepID=A0AAU7JKM7_9HYPH
MSAALNAGFQRPVFDAQSVFRCVMMAMARPGTVRELQVAVDPPGDMASAAAALALAMCDFESPVWLDDALSADPAVHDWLRFHTGAPIVSDPRKASFAFVANAAQLLPLDCFALGSANYPDRSTTVVIGVDWLDREGDWRLAGPGVDGEDRFAAGPLPPDFLAQLSDNHGLFPRGVDIVFAQGDRIAALPRSTIVGK